jgi:SAM-dependent methyltransferase
MSGASTPNSATLMTDAYQSDLAYIHDRGFGLFAENAAQVILHHLRLAGLDRGLTIDLGCGSGILAERLSAAGYDVLGLDISPAMIALARRRAPHARFRKQSWVAAELPPCIAVTAIGEILNYRFDRANTDASLATLFRRVHDALCPGGLFVFDVAEPGRVPGPGPQRTWRDGEDWAVLVAADEDRETRLLTRRITSFRKVGKRYRRKDEVHELRLLRRGELATQLRAIGFRVRLLRSYGAFQFPPGYAGFVARK